MIDWHCHILPGIDDGPATMAEAVQMAKLLRQAGYATVHCTPHFIRGGFEADNDTVRMTLTALQEELDRQGIGLRLLPGREYYLDEFLPDVLKEPLPLGETRYLLIEIPGNAPVEFVKETCYRVVSSGFTPMIAHPERCRLLDLPAPAAGGLREMFKVQGSRFKVFTSTSNIEPETSNIRSNSLLDYLSELGCVFQGNLGSFTGRYGERIRQAAERLHAAGVYTHFGSDAHGVEHLEAIAGR